MNQCGLCGYVYRGGEDFHRDASDCLSSADRDLKDVLSRISRMWSWTVAEKELELSVSDYRLTPAELRRAVLTLSPVLAPKLVNFVKRDLEFHNVSPNPQYSGEYSKIEIIKSLRRNSGEVEEKLDLSSCKDWCDRYYCLFYER